jgi:hypothetical protein
MCGIVSSNPIENEGVPHGYLVEEVGPISHPWSFIVLGVHLGMVKPII